MNYAICDVSGYLWMQHTGRHIRKAVRRHQRRLRRCNRRLPIPVGVFWNEIKFYSAPNVRRYVNIRGATLIALRKEDSNGQ